MNRWMNATFPQDSKLQMENGEASIFSSAYKSRIDSAFQNGDWLSDLQLRFHFPGFPKFIQLTFSALK